MGVGFALEQTLHVVALTMFSFVNSKMALSNSKNLFFDRIYKIYRIKMK
jgi:hypothetical protein